MIQPDDQVAVIVGSIVLGGAVGFLLVQIAFFLVSITMSIIGWIKERAWNRKHLMVMVKSVIGIFVCLVVALLGDYILVIRLGLDYAILDHMIFWSVFLLVLIGFTFHIIRKLRKIRDAVATPEFDDIHVSHDSNIDDYVRKNIELLKSLQDGQNE